MFLLTAVVLVFGFVLLSASPDYPLVASAAPSRQASQSQPGGAQELQSGQKQSAATAQSGRAQPAQQKVGGPTAAGAAVSGGERTVQDDKNTIQSVGRVLDNDEEDFLREEFIEYDTNGDGMLDAYEVRITHPEIANNELFSFFNSVDLNEDGLLTLSEYRDYIESTM